jgi:hypothetical protein
MQTMRVAARAKCGPHAPAHACGSREAPLPRHRRQPRPCSGTGRTAGGGMLPPPPPSPRGSVRRLRAVERVPLPPPPVCWLAPCTSSTLSLVAPTLTVVCRRRVRTTEAEPGVALTAGGSVTIARSVSTGGGGGAPFSAIFTTKGSTVYLYAPTIVEALQLLDQHIDSVPPEQVSYCLIRMRTCVRKTV